MRTHRALLIRWAIPSLIMLIALLAIFSPAVAKADTLIKWSQENARAQQNYSVDGLKLYLVTNKNSAEQSLKLMVVSPAGKSITLYGTKKYLPLLADVLITHLDPLHSKIDVIFGVFTGGAHCCEKIKVLSLIDQRWRMTDLGRWDGDSIPKPRTVKGKVVLVFPDNAFLYAFASYAESGTPLKILRIKNGRVVDESADLDFQTLNRENMIENQSLCAQGGNGGCAAYVASAARIGLFQKAWNFMLTHYNRKSNWKIEFCAVPEKDKCARAIVFDGFPKALAWFLQKYGYLPPAGNGTRKAPARLFLPRTTIP